MSPPIETGRLIFWPFDAGDVEELYRSVYPIPRCEMPGRDIERRSNSSGAVSPRAASDASWMGSASGPSSSRRPGA
jgi:hypothetical protein